MACQLDPYHSSAVIARPGHTKAENNPIISVVLNNRFLLLTHTTCPLWVNREVRLILATQGLKRINTANHQPRGKQSSEGSCTSSQTLNMEMTRYFCCRLIGQNQLYGSSYPQRCQKYQSYHLFWRKRARNIPEAVLMITKYVLSQTLPVWASQSNPLPHPQVLTFCPDLCQLSPPPSADSIFYCYHFTICEPYLYLIFLPTLPVRYLHIKQ